MTNYAPAVLFLLSAAGCGCGSTPGDADTDGADAVVDAPTDVARDQGSDVADTAAGDTDTGDSETSDSDTSDTSDTDADAREWTSPWDYEVSLEVHSTESCLDWEAIEPVAPALPEDTPPRVLWRYEAPYVQHTALSPRGSVWVEAPEPSHYTEVLDGRAIREVSIGLLQRTAQMAVAPDGSLFVLRQGGDFELGPPIREGDLTHIDVPEDTDETTSAYRFRWEPGDNVRMSIGPGGRVYLVRGDTVTAFCRAHTRLWTATISHRPGALAGGIETMMMKPDGTLMVSYLGSSRVFFLGEDGEVVRTTGQEEPPEGGRRSELFATPDVTLSRVVVDDAFENQASVDGELSYAFASPFSPTLSPDGSAWATDPELGRVRRWEVGGSTGNVDVPSSYYEPAAWTSEGDWLRPADRLYRIDHTTGERLWTIDPRPRPTHRGFTSSPGSLSLGPTGIAYAVLFGQVVAIQTDALPPPLSHCVELHCNARRDGWMHPVEE